MISVIDLTERKEAEEELRESEGLQSLHTEKYSDDRKDGE
jgi:hypothetical protein